MTKISVIGLGYVGCVSIGCLADLGHSLTGVDIQKEKVDAINLGSATVVEPDLDDLIRSGVKEKRITATTDIEEAVAKSDISILCVGTPLGDSGSLDLSAIYSVAREVANALKHKDMYHVIVIRSTVSPGTCADVEELVAEVSGKKAGEQFDVIINPEFLREGSAVRDFLNPAIHLIGGKNVYAAELVADIYNKIQAPIEFTQWKEAEIMKYVNNTFHALKVTFANEIGNICKCLKIDSHEVMRIFCQDKQLNISSYYLRPGFAFGGSCLPKDTSALNELATDSGLSTPLISSIIPSNNNQIKMASNLILSYNVENIGVLGLSFKSNTDDLRNSPILLVIQQLLENGRKILAYDPQIARSRLIGANAQVMDEQFPFLRGVCTSDIESTMQFADLVVVSKKEQEFSSMCITYDKPVIDLANIFEKSSALKSYEGLNW